jgi:enoyl-CoA hydratase/carnithine racemase
MWTGLAEVCGAIAARPEVRAVIIAGAGQKAFASGADISEFSEIRSNALQNRAFTDAVEAACNAIMTLPIPVIAAIEGYCIGGGVVIASACDMRICSDTSQFGVPAARLGLAYELDNYRRLFEIVGPAWSFELLATARRITAAEALGARFVTRIVEAGRVVEEARALAAMIADNAPLTVRAAKAASRFCRSVGGRDEAEQAIDRCFDSDDFVEGRAAFAERRPPVFVGR